MIALDKTMTPLGSSLWQGIGCERVVFYFQGPKVQYSSTVYVKWISINSHVCVYRLATATVQEAVGEDAAGGPETRSPRVGGTLYRCSGASLGISTKK